MWKDNCLIVSGQLSHDLTASSVLRQVFNLYQLIRLETSLIIFRLTQQYLCLNNQLVQSTLCSTHKHEPRDMTSSIAAQLAARRASWLERPPSVLHGHPWYAFRSVSHRWVDLNAHSRENTMRAILEHLFQRPFPKVRPNFLRNPVTQRCLELDAFCAELRIAVEHDGVQHSRFPNPFHSTRAQFERQRARDKLKTQLCAENGIKLVVLPYLVPREEMASFLIAQLGSELLAHASPRQRPGCARFDVRDRHHDDAVEVDTRLEPVVTQSASLALTPPAVADAMVRDDEEEVVLEAMGGLTLLAEF